MLPPSRNKKDFQTAPRNLCLYVQGQSSVPVKEVVRSIYGEVESKGVKVDVVDVCFIYFTSCHKKFTFVFY